MYFSDVDDAGHRYSPKSEETKDAVRHVDKMIARLIKGLKKRNAFKYMNLVIVSDHGMSANSLSPDSSIGVWQCGQRTCMDSPFGLAE